MHRKGGCEGCVHHTKGYGRLGQGRVMGDKVG